MSGKFKSVIQFMIANGCVPAPKFRSMLEELAGDERSSQLTDEDIFNLVQKTNRRLAKFNLMVRQLMDEVTTGKYYILISTVDNDITRAACLHSPKQLEFFKQLLQSIVNDPCGIILEKSVKECADRATVALVSKGRGQLPEYKRLFNDWCQGGWFMMVTEGDTDFVTLGVRTMAELDVFIKQNLVEKAEDLDCKSCNNISIYSVTCPSCESRFHKRCAKMMIDHETGKCRSCPGTSGSSLSRRQSSQASGRRSRRSR